MHAFLLHTIFVFIGLNLLSLPLLNASPTLIPGSKKELAEHMLTILAIAAALAMLST